MRLNIKENPNAKEIDIQIICRAIDENVARLERHIRLFERALTAIWQNARVLIPAKEVYYVESVDKRCYLYTETQVLQTEYRLYELEEDLADCGFIRASKSLVINLQHVQFLKPELNRTLIAGMENGEKLIISRQHAKELKRRIGAKGRQA